MQKLNPKKAEDNPLAASILGAVLVKASRESGDKQQEKAGLDLIKIAEANPDKMPKLKPNSKMAKAIKAAKVVGFADLGMEAIYEFDLQDMPVTVAVDAQGSSVHTTGPIEWCTKIGKLPADKLFGNKH